MYRFMRNQVRVSPRDFPRPRTRYFEPYGEICGCLGNRILLHTANSVVTRIWNNTNSDNNDNDNNSSSGLCEAHFSDV